VDPEAVEAAVEPAKTARGRPKSKKVEVEEPQVEEAPKKARGRAKKVIVEEPVEEPIVEEAPKKARGRAKKVTIEGPVEAQVEEAPKKGRGRPKKVTIEEPVEVPAEEAPKKRRGPVKKVTIQAPGEEEEEEEEEDEEEEEELEEAPKKGRGKAKAKVAAPYSEIEVEEPSKAAPKRGRPKSTKTDTSQTEKPAPKKRGRKAAEPALVEEVATEEPKKKKRGRPSKSDIAEPESQPEPPKSTSPKKRGRPSFASIAEAQAKSPTPKKRGRPSFASLAEPQTKSPTPKKRGRPSFASLAEAQAKLPTPKKRGRPSFASLLEAQTNSSTPKKLGRPSFASLAEAQAKSSTPKKRGRPSLNRDVEVEGETRAKKRGRPSKAATEVSLTPNRDTSGFTPATAPARQITAQQTPGSSAKRGPGRPPKAANMIPSPRTATKLRISQSRASTSASIPNTPATGSARRGRPPKRRSSVEDIFYDAPEPEKQNVDEDTSKATTQSRILPEQTSKPGRRKTMAGRAGPKTPKVTKPFAVPGTAPPKAAAGPVRNSRVSFANEAEGNAEEEEMLEQEAEEIEKAEEEVAEPAEQTETTVPSRKAFDFTTGESSKPSRRKTVASRLNTATPKTTKSTTIPGTAPPKATGRGRKAKVSFEPVDTIDDSITLGVVEAVSPEKPIEESEIQSPSEYLDARELPKSPATPKVKKASLKPPQTAPAQARLSKTEKSKKRARVSSPGPSNKAKPSPKKAKLDEATLAQDSWDGLYLLKAEPESRIEKGKDVKFSIDDLRNTTKPEPWSGVRNYAARNNMMAMKEGSLAFFYHSNCKEPGIVGIMEVAQEATVDESAFDPNDPYYDPRSAPEKPKWFNVHVAFKHKFDDPSKTSLSGLRQYAVPGGPLENMAVMKQGRLSVSKVAKEEWNFIVNLAGCPQYQVEIAIPEPDSEFDTTMMSEPVLTSPTSITEAEATSAFISEAIENIAETVATEIAEETHQTEVAEELAHEIADEITEQVTAQLENEANVDESDFNIVVGKQSWSFLYTFTNNPRRGDVRC
jgi:predicted RNA-binding protein with PUA-like domain